MAENRELPHNFLLQEQYLKIFDERSQQILSDLPELYNRTHERSCRALVMDTYGEDCILTMKLFPVRVKNGMNEAEPILIAHCQWSGYTQMLYWPLKTKEIFYLPQEIEYIYDMVKEDDFYYQTNIWD